MQSTSISAPLTLLMAEIIRDACSSGHRWFDFNPSGGLEGVANRSRPALARAL